MLRCHGVRSLCRNTRHILMGDVKNCYVTWRASMVFVESRSKLLCRLMIGDWQTEAIWEVWEVLGPWSGFSLVVHKDSLLRCNVGLRVWVWMPTVSISSRLAGSLDTLPNVDTTVMSLFCNPCTPNQSFALGMAPSALVDCVHDHGLRHPLTSHLEQILCDVPNFLRQRVGLIRADS